MERAIISILRRRKLVIAFFALLAAVGFLASSQIRINYTVTDYMPSSTPSTVALREMQTSYTQPLPNLRVMVPRVSVAEALDIKARLKTVEGVSEVTWLDDDVDINVPLIMQKKESVNAWYKDENALFSIVLDSADLDSSLTIIREIIGDEGAMSGSVVNTADTRATSKADGKQRNFYIFPVIILILLLTTNSWIAPLLFIINIAVAIGINSGTNLLLGELSFVTSTTAIVLQAACSMDYSVFLLHRFERMRAEGLSPLPAMVKATMGSGLSILSSGFTTFVGFAALIAMQFGIGPNMGIVMAKSIVCSLLTTLIFMPCLIICCETLIEKTTHHSFLPSFTGLATCMDKIKGVVSLVVLLLLVPCFLAQSNLNFDFGASNMAREDSRVVADRKTIAEIFGESSSFALLVPLGYMSEEKALGDEIKRLPEVTSLQSYASTVGLTVPSDMIPPEKLALLNSEKYTRLVISARVPPESEETFAFVERLRSLGEAYYPGTYLLAGEATSVYDLKKTILSDAKMVNILSIGGIALILFLTFRSVGLPIILLITIESAIFINVSIPYFMDTPLHYIVYLIISSVQLGATVDYAILFTDRYRENRCRLSRKKAARQTVEDCASSILTSAAILFASGLILSLTSSNLVIGQLGMLLARGTLLSFVFVFALLPALLVKFESLIPKISLQLKSGILEQEEDTPYDTQS